MSLCSALTFSIAFAIAALELSAYFCHMSYGIAKPLLPRANAAQSPCNVPKLNPFSG